MTLAEILFGSTGGLVLLLTLIQIAPIKINPWSAIVKRIVRAFNSEVMDKLNEVSDAQKETRVLLDEHIQADVESKVDDRRTRILRFNNELLRGIPHTKEEFHEVLVDIDVYEIYCRDHKDYKNGRAVHAIANIGRVYDERLKRNDFLN